jgi:UDP-N-acetylglucosamine--N-acetylmuramyl-(pentapeptide) pyrophosphoryl-undecaprenol N-acetylglucosamine transferase
MAAADVIVSRAGALTLSELALVGRAAVLIPSPNVVANHQYFNAKALADKGAAILIEEKDLSSKTYADTIDLLIGNKEKREELERKIKEFSVEDSKEKILEEIEMLLKSKKKK